MLKIYELVIQDNESVIENREKTKSMSNAHVGSTPAKIWDFSVKVFDDYNFKKWDINKTDIICVTQWHENSVSHLLHTVITRERDVFMTNFTGGLCPAVDVFDSYDNNDDNDGEVPISKIRFLLPSLKLTRRYNPSVKGWNLHTILPLF